MEVYVVEKITEIDGTIDTNVRVFTTLENAIKCKEDMQNNNFVEDVKKSIDDGNVDNFIHDGNNYFCCYDAYTFEELTITIITCRLEDLYE